VTEAGKRQRTEIAISIVGLAVAIAGLVLLVVNRELLSWNPVVVAVQVVAVLLWIWARATFGLRSFHAAANPTAGGLVTTGPYRFLRHPVYDSVLYFAWAGALGNASVSSIGAAALVTAGLTVRMLAEEKLLRRTYPEYGDAMRRAKRFIPFVF